MGDRDGKIWSLPFSYVDPVVSVELSVTLYELDSGGRGAQFTLLSKHPGGRTMAVRLPEELAARLALKVLAALDGDPACCRRLDELSEQVAALTSAAEYERTLRLERDG